MLNQTVLVGRIVQDIETKELESGKKVAYITLAVPRTFKNVDGKYETDFIPCILFGNVAESTKEYCKKDDIVGIKGRLQSTNGSLEFIAEKVTFLSNKKESEEKE